LLRGPGPLLSISSICVRVPPWDYVFWKLRSGSAVNHGVGIFDTNAIPAIVCLGEIRYGVVRIPVCPVAFPIRRQREAVTGFAPA
jgi:hypothetical protein